MNSLIIARREFFAYFTWPLAYLIGAVFLFVAGLFFYFTVAVNQVATLSRVFNAAGGALAFVAPLLTMHLLSRETQSGNLELLLSTPVRDWEIVTGKFLAALLFLAFMLLPTFSYLLLLTLYGNPDWAMAFSGYLGILLLGAALVGVGVFTSALAGNQVVAAMLGIALGLVFWLIGEVGVMVGGVAGAALDFISTQPHFADFVQGLISSANIVYFLSVTAVALFVSTRILEARRWRL